MAIKAILVDRDREIFPLLGDIFNVTGHKLLIATSDETFKELVSSTKVDIVIVNHAEVKSWLLACTEEGIPLPFFIVDTEEEERRLKSLGFSELNFVRKPFNPLELLNRLSYLHRADPLEEPNRLGFVSTLVKLRDRKESKIVELEGSFTCEVGIKEGKVVGVNPNLESVRTLLEEGASLKIREFEELPWERTFEDTLDFLKALIEKTRPVEVRPPAGEGLPKELKSVEEVGDGVYRVSKFSGIPVLLKNVYLRIYEREERRVAFLINAGSLDEWSGIRNLVEDLILDLGEIDAVVLLSGDPLSAYNVFVLGDQHRRGFQVIADYPTKRFLSESGFKGKVRTLEDFPSRTVTIATGHRIRFVPLSFSPHPGGFCLYEEDTGYLFAPDLFSSFFTESPDDPLECIRLFHRVYMPSGEVLGREVRRLSDLPVKKVFPRYGLPYEDFGEVVKLLSDMKAGTDYPPVSDTETAISLMNSSLNTVMNSEEKGVSDKFVEELSRFATVEGGMVTEIYVDPDFALELLLSSLVTLPGVKPSTIVRVLKDIDRAGVFINPF